MKSMTESSVAVIGTGPAGLSMLKTLREDGFKVTAFERRDKVGGLWAYSENPEYTTALPGTNANISKFTCGYTDFPMSDRFPPYLRQYQFQEFMQEYCEKFDLLKDIVFNAYVRKVERNVDDTKWVIKLDKGDSAEAVEFDKVVFCHGYQTFAKMPVHPGQDLFTGTLIHSQQYRRPDEFRGKNVVIVGFSSSTDDIVPDVVPHAAKVYISHRRGVLPVTRMRNGTPGDLLVTWRRRLINQWLMHYTPRLHKGFADQCLKYFGRSLAKIPLDPAWRLEPFPSIMLKLPGLTENVLPMLADGRVTSLRGIKRFLGAKTIEFEDGTILDDIDAVIFCTGYRADWSAAPFVETSTPTAHGYKGRPMTRLYMNLFPPRYADSCAMLCYSAFGKNNGFSFSDVISMAISNVWRGVSSDMMPGRQEMERWVDEQQAWVAGRWALDPNIDISMVRQWIFQPWNHAAAGTGMENLGWGWKGWSFWLRDRKMSNMMNNGVETAHMFRFFETDKRKAWPGARDEIMHQNELVKQIFPLKETRDASK